MRIRSSIAATVIRCWSSIHRRSEPGEGRNQVSVTGRNGEPATEILPGARCGLVDNHGTPIE